MGFRRKKPAAIGIKAPYPGFIEPELATAIDNVPSGKRWLQEIKFDSYRVQVHLGDAAVKSVPVAVMWGKRHGSYFY
jgi:bifunctional non-homologous end joining protein LigD